MEWIFRNAWILFIAVTCANAAVWWARGKQEIATHPEREEGYRVLVRGLILYGNLPWVVMGIGIAFGGVPSVFHYFNPRNGAFVIAWYATVVALWVAVGYWIFFRDGAVALIRHPGLLNIPVQEPWVVKASAVLMFMGGLTAFAMMFFWDIQPLE